jgi:hypothetical protein
VRAAFGRGPIAMKSPERSSRSLFVRSGRRFDNGSFHRVYRARSDAPFETETMPTVLQRPRQRCDAPQQANGDTYPDNSDNHTVSVATGSAVRHPSSFVIGGRAANARRHKNRIRRLLRGSRPTRQHFRLHKHVQLAGDRVRAVS